MLNKKGETMNKHDLIGRTLDSIIKSFESGDVPKMIAKAKYPEYHVPMQAWSLLNRLVCYYSGSEDFRGYKQWNLVNRHVVKGAKAVYILVPRLISAENDEKSVGGFLAVPVYRVEDTDGDQLEYMKITIPNFPLMEKAQEWGISIKTTSGNDKFYGCLYQDQKLIKLASPEECVFFHEMTHYADKLNIGKLVNGQDPIQEIVAELGAAALCRIVGLDGDKHLGNHYQYISSYAKEIKMSPHRACMSVISRVEKALNLMLNPTE